MNQQEWLFFCGVIVNFCVVFALDMTALSFVGNGYELKNDNKVMEGEKDATIYL